MKRPIAEVRKEIYELDWGMQYGIIRGDGIAFYEPELVTVEEARAKLDALKAEYPGWEKTRRTK